MMDDETREIIRRLTDITEAREKRIDELRAKLATAEQSCQGLIDAILACPCQRCGSAAAALREKRERETRHTIAAKENQ